MVQILKLTKNSAIQLIFAPMLQKILAQFQEIAVIAA